MNAKAKLEYAEGLRQVIEEKVEQIAAYARRQGLDENPGCMHQVYQEVALTKNSVQSFTGLCREIFSDYFGTDLWPSWMPSLDPPKGDYRTMNESQIYWGDWRSWIKSWDEALKAVRQSAK